MKWAYHTLPDVFNYQIRIVRESRPSACVSSTAVYTATKIAEPSARISRSPSETRVICAFHFVKLALFPTFVHLATYLDEVLKPRAHLCHKLRSGYVPEVRSALIAQDVKTPIM